MFDHAHRARFRRLRPGIPRTQPIDAIFHPAAIIEGDRNLAAGIARLRGAGNPVNAFGRIHRQPFVKTQLIQQARFALHQQTQTIALAGIVDDEVIALPIREAVDQLAIERIVDVVGAERGIVRGLHVLCLSPQGQGSRATTRFGLAFINRFHSLMYSRMNASSVAGAVMIPSSCVFTRPGMPRPRCM